MSNNTNTNKVVSQLCSRRRRSHGGGSVVGHRSSMTSSASSSSMMTIIGFLVALVAAAATTFTTSSCFCDAFSSSSRHHQISLPISRIHNNVERRAAIPNYLLQQQQQQQQRLSNYYGRLTATTTRLYVAKTGGKMINTEDQFAEMVLAKDVPRPVLVFFSAPWCGPCRLTVPVVKDVMKQYSGDIDVVEICTDDLAEVAEEAGVVSIPTIQFYFAGKALETHSIVGCVAKTVLANAVGKVLEDVAQLQQQKAPQ